MPSPHQPRTWRTPAPGHRPLLDRIAHLPSQHPALQPVVTHFRRSSERQQLQLSLAGERLIRARRIFQAMAEGRPLPAGAPVVAPASDLGPLDEEIGRYLHQDEGAERETTTIATIIRAGISSSGGDVVRLAQGLGCAPEQLLAATIGAFVPAVADLPTWAAVLGLSDHERLALVALVVAERLNPGEREAIQQMVAADRHLRDELAAMNACLAKVEAILAGSR